MTDSTRSRTPSRLARMESSDSSCFSARGPSAPSTPLRTPLTSSTRGAGAIKSGAGASASPQVKVALAAMRNKQRNSARSGQTASSTSALPTNSGSKAIASSSSLASSSSSMMMGVEQYDAYSTPPRRAVQSGNDFEEDDAVQEFRFGQRTIAVRAEQRQTAQEREEDVEEEEEVVLDWGTRAKSTRDVVEGAKRTGVLVLASRELKSIPLLVYEALMSKASVYHPTRQRTRASGSKGKDPAPIIDFSTSYDDRKTAWYEQRELRSLSVANNDIKEIQEMIAGFEELETLDLHNNYLVSLPTSLAQLTNLTSLNLSANKLTTFPIQLLALHSLTSLNLASNQLTHLWPVDWRLHLSDTLHPPSLSPTATPESSPEQSGGHVLGFWSTPAPSATPDSPSSTDTPFKAPLTRLTELILSDNPFSPDVFQDPGWSFPSKLRELHLADSGLVETSFPALVFGKLAHLQELILAGADILSSPFHLEDVVDEESELFPSLTRLDLSRNSIDSLLHLEAFFVRHVKRPIEYVGLEKSIMNLVKAKGRPNGDVEGREEVRIVLHDNPMREEQVRRRALFGRPAASEGFKEGVEVELANAAPTKNTVKRRVVKEQWEIDAENGLLTEGGRRRARIEAMRRAKEEEEMRKEVERRGEKVEVDETGTIVGALLGLKVKDGDEKGQEAAVGREQAQEEEAPPPEYSPTPTPVAPILTPEAPGAAAPAEASKDDPAIQLVSLAHKVISSTIDLSSKSLETLPTPLGSPPSHLSSPSSLVLSRNQFRSLSTSALSAWTWANTLRSLDLSYNRLTVFTPDSPLLNLTSLNLSNNQLTELDPNLASSTSNLTSLDLSRNRLTSDSSLSPFFRLNSSTPSSLTTLNLSGNSLSSLPALIELATTIRGPSSLDQARSKHNLSLRSLDLRDNDLLKLETKLGWLPLGLEMWLSGNRFRVPRREVYDSAQGAKEIVGWLRERIAEV
ncbi:BQ5605_C033g11189 [Microbotryum silenes-dioicae]|uniref:BQ5605_C033g11189 protein n=1 Tax=Microbotryum silenes-dioicae TaxID=796604 RepID=A0A2X0N325_9BASI|nr:BQ5605_C033g11189 [Microbotryum silenes-dioicae]